MSNFGTILGGRVSCVVLKPGHTTVVGMLLNIGAGLNATKGRGTTLVVANQKGRNAAVQLLLEKGATTEGKNDIGDTALTLAREYGHVGAEILLVDVHRRLRASSAD